MSHLITCQDCGHEYEAKRIDTKYCAVCRLYRDVTYCGTKKHTCVSCSEKFAQITRSDLLCSNCDFRESSLHGHGDCAMCGKTNTKTIRREVAVCLDCAKDPSKRILFIRALAQKVHNRKHASP